MENQQTTVIDVTNLPTLQELERQYLNLVLGRTSGSKAEAAKILGVSVKTVYNKLDAYKEQMTSTVTQS
jgi:DNA-binding NtrC family response regulator